MENELNPDISEKLATSLTASMPPDLMICCFCGQEYLFEFTMRHHLVQQHKLELQKLDNWPCNLHPCPYCRSSFYYKSLVPKHIAFSHSKKALDQWFAVDDNLQKFQIDKENEDEPSFKFLDTSPGLNTLFNELDTCCGDSSVKKFKRNDSAVIVTPKSILKNRYSNKIVILSPESVALRRTLNNLKRTASARRELRFDLPPLQPSPETKNTEDLLPNFIMSPKKKKLNIWSLFTRKTRSPPPINGKIKKRIREKACKLSNRSINRMLTSTPSRASDPFDATDDVGCDELDNSIGSNWKTATKSNDFNPPLFLSAERFQCNICEAKFDSNCELLTHQKEKHRWLTFKPSFRCGSCGTKFFRNSLLVRHCHNHSIF